MQSIIVTIAPEPTQTRLLMVDQTGNDVLKAVLPVASTAHPHAARTLLEGLALWHNRPLSVVLCVDDLDGSCDGLGLYDGLGFGTRQLHFDVAVVPRKHGSRPRRLSGVAKFTDLRQLSLEVDHG